MSGLSLGGFAVWIIDLLVCLFPAAFGSLSVLLFIECC